MAPKKDPEMEKLKTELNSLAEKCREKQKAACDNNDVGSGSGLPGGKIIKRRDLKGHINKVTCCFFSPADSRHAVTGSLDGKLIIWDCWSGGKSQVHNQMINQLQAINFCAHFLKSKYYVHLFSDSPKFLKKMPLAGV